MSSVCPLYVSLQMRQRPSVPTHHRALSSPADVTHPASVIERDANPAPLQSLAVGRGGTGRDIERDRRKEVGCKGGKGAHAGFGLADGLGTDLHK